MQESDRNELAETLQNKTAMSRMTHGEIVSAIAFLESAGYEVTKREVFEEQTFKVDDLREEPAPVVEPEPEPSFKTFSEQAAVEGENHA